MNRIIAVLLILTAVSYVMGPVYSQQYIAGYRLASEEVLRSIPVEYINKAREELVVAYEHTSHGTHVSRGMFGLPGYKPGDQELFAISLNQEEAGKLWFMDDAMADYPPGAVDLSVGETSFVETTRNFLDAEENARVNVVMWAWCDISGHDVSGNYLPGMQALIDEYGEGGSKIGNGEGQRENAVYFIFMTGHATGGNNVGDGRPKNQADLINQYCNTNAYLCLDYYSIDTHDMEGNYWEDANDNGESDTYGGNFYQDYQDAHSVGDGYYENLSSPGGAVEYGTHTTQHITSNRKAYAMWWILARIAGWDGGEATVVSPPGHADLFIYPNPGSGMFHLHASGLNVQEIKVMDALGRFVKEYEYPAGDPAGDPGRISLDLSDREPGVYFLLVVSDKGSTVHPIINNTK